MRVRVFVTLKKGVHDPQGEAVLGTLKHLGFAGIQGVRVGKYLELDLKTAPKEELDQQVKNMCEKLLANPVIESYAFELIAES